MWARGLSFVLAVGFCACSAQEQKEQRKPSTKEERDRFVEIAETLEKDPLKPELKDARSAAMAFLIEVPDIHVSICNFMPPLLEKKSPKIATDLFAVFMLASARFQIQHPERQNDPLLINAAAADAVLNAYEAALKTRPKDRIPEFDQLLLSRKDGGVGEYAKSRIKKCADIEPDVIPELPAETTDQQLLRIANEHMHTGQLLHDEGRFAVALLEYERVVRLLPRNSGPLFEQAYSYNKMGNQAKALSLAKQAVELEPGCSDCYDQLGSLLDDTGDTEGALAAFRHAAELNPNSAIPLVNQGVTLHRLHRDEDARRAFAAAITRDPNFAASYFRLGMLEAKAGLLYSGRENLRIFIAKAKPSDERVEMAKNALKFSISTSNLKDLAKPVQDALLAYAQVRAEWLDQFQKTHPSEPKYLHSVEAELAALDAQALAWETAKKFDPKIQDPDLDRLLRIKAAGHLKPFAAVTLHKTWSEVGSAWQAAYPTAIADLQGWATTNNVALTPVNARLKMTWFELEFP